MFLDIFVNFQKKPPEMVQKNIFSRKSSVFWRACRPNSCRRAFPDVRRGAQAKIGKIGMGPLRRNQPNFPQHLKQHLKRFSKKTFQMLYLNGCKTFQMLKFTPAPKFSTLTRRRSAVSWPTDLKLAHVTPTLFPFPKPASAPCRRHHGRRWNR